MNKSRTGDIRHCVSDISKAERLLGYTPRYAVEDSLGELAEWVAAQRATDNVGAARKELEARGLVV